MTVPATEKAAPIPAEGPRGADVQRLADRCAQAVYSAIGRRDITRPIKEAIVDAILADRASQEERIREDERDRLYEAADRHSREVSPRNFLARQGGMFPFERALQRGDAS